VLDNGVVDVLAVGAVGAAPVLKVVVVVVLVGLVVDVGAIETCAVGEDTGVDCNRSTGRCALPLAFMYMIKDAGGVPNISFGALYFLICMIILLNG
jgi:hypothetical protein